jgi:hypothetical protein
VSAYNLTRDDLVVQLKAQVGFLERSAAAFDQGYDDEATRLAVVIRVLVHDTSNSHSLLGQLGEKSNLAFLDTAAPILAGNLLGTPGLVLFRSDGRQVTYAPKLDESLRRNAKPFERWWHDPVTKDSDGTLFTRRDYILALANKEGGTHVDPNLNAEWAALTRRNSLGFFGANSKGQSVPLGSPAAPSVRQIAYELDQTLRSQLAHLLQYG